jgi:hypothetical protein
VADLYAPCVRSGFCCKQAPCSAGDVTSDVDPSCRFLEVAREVQGVPIHRCGKHEEIVSRPGYGLLPMFGSGCSSTLFNEDRARVLRVLDLADVAPVRLAESDPAG